MELKGFEPSTSALRTKRTSNILDVEPHENAGSDENGAPMHHWMHQIAELDENEAVDVLAKALIETLGFEAVRRLADALHSKAVDPDC